MIRISGVLIKILSDFLNSRYQRVVLNGQTSNWSKIKAGVPQGSILGPLLLNDLSVGLSPIQLCGLGFDPSMRHLWQVSGLYKLIYLLVRDPLLVNSKIVC